MWQSPDTPSQQQVDDVLTLVQVDASTGLSSDEVAERRTVLGTNILDAAPPEPAWRKLLAQFKDPLVILLIVATAISITAWLIEDEGSWPIDAVVIIGIVIANAALGLWQERRAEQAVAALQSMTQTHCQVMRNSAPTTIASSELVVGDILVLAEGDAVGADARLVETASLKVAEAPLTGESTAVSKQTEPLGPAPIGDRTNMVFNGTAVASGRGVAVVTATGMATQMGEIATLLSEQDEQPTPLQREIGRVGRLLGIGVLILTVIVVGAILLTSDIDGFSGYVDALLVGVSLAVAAVPEGLPAILSVVLALGVQRMATSNAVVKKLPSVETLGAASVICTDKTGTLTRNEMTITTAVTPSAIVEIGDDATVTDTSNGNTAASGPVRNELIALIGAGSLANDAVVQLGDDGGWNVMGDPTEAAFLMAEQRLGGSEQRLQRFDRLDEVPFDSDRKMMTTVNADHDPAGPEVLVVTKGAPDVLLGRCVAEHQNGAPMALTPERRQHYLDATDQLAGDALRTLAVAYRADDAVDGPADESIEHDLVLLGIVGIMDPPRPEVRDAIADAHRAGVRIVVITGDHPMTAVRIAGDLGVTSPGQPSLNGTQLAELADDEFAEAVRTTNVYARVSPADKLRIVDQLLADGEIVAMTGDGVNDAPALRRADIGVAMGITGTEVSKEAADMILADDNFATIVDGVREGRAIFANIAKFLRYLLSSNAGEVGVMFIGIVAGSAIGLTALDGELAVPLLATQILWINLLTDTGLALALGIDPPVDDPMTGPPRRSTDRIIDRRMVATIFLTGIVLALAGLIVLDLELAGGLLGGDGDIVSARTQVFTTLVLGNIFAAFNSRSETASAAHRLFSNRLLWLAVAVTIALQVIVVHLPPLQTAFDTSSMSVTDWVRCFLFASTVLWAEELRKLLQRRHRSARR